jgi:ribosomal protein L24
MKTREELVLERMNLVSEKQKELSTLEKTRIAVNDIEAKILRVNVEINKFHNPEPIGGCNKKEQNDIVRVYYCENCKKGMEVKDS